MKLNFRKILVVFLGLFFVSGGLAFSLDGVASAAKDATQDLADEANQRLEKYNETNVSKVEEDISNISSQLSDIARDKRLDIDLVESEASSMGVTGSTAGRIESNLQVATNLTNNDSARKELSLDTANEICNTAPDLKDLGSTMKELEDRKLDAKRLENAAGILSENYNMDIDPDRFQKSYKTLRDASKYAPIIGSYLNLVNKSCEVKAGDEDSFKEFYQASAYFGAEVVLVEAGVAYKVSSKSVRLMNNKAGMARIRGYCGDECYSAVLSEAHWLVRGTQQGMKDYIFYESEELGEKISEQKIYTYIDRNYERFQKKMEGPQLTGAAVGGVNQGLVSRIMAWLGL